MFGKTGYVKIHQEKWRKEWESNPQPSASDFRLCCRSPRGLDRPLEPRQGTHIGEFDVLDFMQPHLHPVCLSEFTSGLLGGLAESPLLPWGIGDRAMRVLLAAIVIYCFWSVKTINVYSKPSQPMVRSLASKSISLMGWRPYRAARLRACTISG